MKIKLFIGNWEDEKRLFLFFQLKLHFKFLNIIKLN